jgi:hypothetical protein
VATAGSFRPPTQAAGDAASLTQNEKIAAEVFQQNSSYELTPFMG